MIYRNTTAPAAQPVIRRITTIRALDDLVQDQIDFLHTGTAAAAPLKSDTIDEH